MRSMTWLFLAACGGPAAEPQSPATEPKPVEVVSIPDAAAPPLTVEDPKPKRPELAEEPPKEEKDEPKTDPSNGTFSLAEATDGLSGTGALVATIKTSKGNLTCTLYDDKAPIAVANFVGLARGVRSWKDPTGTWVKRPLYDGTTFHRVIKGFMIQGGDPKGNGTGEPGYVFADEIWKGAKHDRAGLLCMANRGPNTNGAQFFITDAAAPHLDRSYTIFGECAPVAVVHAIANVPTQRPDRPVTDVIISSVEIARKKK